MGRCSQWNARGPAVSVTSTSGQVTSCDLSCDPMTYVVYRFLSKPGHMEKRFPVDRKKLERLIVGRHHNRRTHKILPPSLPFSPSSHTPWYMVAGRNDKESAAEFFDSVMVTTSTLILWPSKLKIGAKSKKGSSPQNSRTSSAKLHVCFALARCTYIYIQVYIHVYLPCMFVDI